MSKRYIFNGVFLLITPALLAILNTNLISAQDGIKTPPENEVAEERLEGKVIKILNEEKREVSGSDAPQLYQKLQILVTRGSISGQNIEVENGTLAISNTRAYKKGDQLVISYNRGPNNNDTLYITDYVRRTSLTWLFLIFVISVLLVGRWQGASSLMGTFLSFLVIFKFILPKIMGGSDPIVTVVIGALLIVPMTFVLSHGANLKTAVATAGTVIALLLTAILAKVFVGATMLTGFASEEAGFLQAYKPGLINMEGLLLAGIIIGVLGVLDDVTVSQSSIVFQLKAANINLSLRELYNRAMAVGRDHIASMVNTLVLVYTGASLPLLLLFVSNPLPFSEVLNYEFIADEVVRTLVGSIGLIFSVPITTMIATIVVANITYRRG